MPDTTLLWLYPDRDTAGKTEYAEEHYWSHRRSAAARAGFRFLLKAPQDLVLHRAEDGRIRLTIDAEEIERDATILVADISLDPRALPDLWGCLSTLLCLEIAGYHLATPLRWLLVGSEKFATLNSLADLGLRSLPTLRVIPNHHLDGTGVAEAAAGLGFPLVVRPASWYAGMGACFVDTGPQLEQVLSLAAGYDQPFVIQHRLPEPLTDTRAYCVDGRVLAFVQRFARPDEPLNSRTGYTATLGTPPEFITAAAEKLFRRTGLAYFSIDMLFDGTGWWLTEIEVDAGALPVGEFDDAQVAMVLDARFAGYRRRLVGVRS